MRRTSAVHFRITKLDVTADGVGDQWRNGSIARCLSEKSRVSVTRTRRCVADDTLARHAVLLGAAIRHIAIEDFCDAALRRVRHPIFAVTDLVELDVLELSVSCHCDLK